MVVAFVWWGIPVVIAKIRNNNVLPTFFLAVLIFSMDFSMGFLKGRSLPLGFLVIAWGFAVYLPFMKKDLSSMFPAVMQFKKPEPKEVAEESSLENNPK